MVGIAKSLLSFVFFKGIVFFSVIFFSVLGFTEEYIQLEKNIALATMVTPFLVFGLTMSFSHYNLTKKTNKYDWFYWNHLKYSTIVLVLLFLCFSFFQWPNQNAVLLLILFVFARFYSQSFKIKNNVHYSSLIDALPYIFISVSLVFLIAGINLNSVFTLLFFPIIYFIFRQLNFKLSTLSFKGIEPHEFYAFGGKAFYVSAIVVAVTMIPRAFVDYFIGDSDIESFLLSLRYATISVLLYQFFSIKFFSKIYSLEHGKILLFGSLIFSIVFLFTLLCLYLIGLFGFIDNSNFNFLSALITSIWVTVSFFEYFVSKSERQSMFLLAVIILLAFSFFFLALVSGFVSKQYMLIVCFTCVVISQLVAIFYKNFTRMLSEVATCSILIIIFGLHHV